MSLTVTVKDELALVVTENAAQRRAEVSAMLRFAGGLHIVSGRIVVEAELDHGGAVRRLHQHLKELYWAMAAPMPRVAPVTRAICWVEPVMKTSLLPLMKLEMAASKRLAGPRITAP